MLPLSLRDWANVRVVEALGSLPRASLAYRELLRRGQSAVAAIRVGLRHEDAAVRQHCCGLLDHLVVEDALPDLLAMLGDEDAGVRLAAVHAVSCDRCKQECPLPAEPVVLPAGMRLLELDPHPLVRAVAVELVGRFAYNNADAAHSLIRACECDPSPAVRKKARLYAPGGSIFRRRAPKPSRKRSGAAAEL